MGTPSSQPLSLLIFSCWRLSVSFAFVLAFVRSCCQRCHLRQDRQYCITSTAQRLCGRGSMVSGMLYVPRGLGAYRRTTCFPSFCLSHPSNKHSHQHQSNLSTLEVFYLSGPRTQSFPKIC